MKVGTEQKDEAPRSQTSLTYFNLRSAILAGHIRPGEKLKIAEIAERYDVSLGAVREALSRLVPEKLVISQDQRGFTVTPLLISDLNNLTDLRCEIEAIALRRSVENGGLDWEASIMASAHRLHGTPRLADEGQTLATDWAKEHADFHTALVSACGNPKLIELHRQLYEQTDRYRVLSVSRESGKRQVDAEHFAMVKAALAHDADNLIRLVIDHIRLTTELVIESL